MPPANELPEMPQIISKYARERGTARNDRGEFMAGACASRGGQGKCVLSICVLSIDQRLSEVDVVRVLAYRADVNMPTQTDILESPTRQLMDRGRKTLESVLQKAGAASLTTLQTSTNEVNFLMAATRLAIEALGGPGDATQARMNQARLRGLTRMVELRKAAEPCLETGQVCELLGVSRETIRKKVDRKQLLALPKGGDRVFPAFQFKEGDVVPGFREVLEALDTDSPFVALSFLLSQSPDFGNQTAIGALQSKDKGKVILDARSFLKHGG